MLLSQNKETKFTEEEFFFFFFPIVFSQCCLTLIFPWSAGGTITQFWAKQYSDQEMGDRRYRNITQTNFFGQFSLSQGLILVAEIALNRVIYFFFFISMCTLSCHAVCIVKVKD